MLGPGSARAERRQRAVEAEPKLRRRPPSMAALVLPDTERNIRKRRPRALCVGLQLCFERHEDVERFLTPRHRWQRGSSEGLPLKSDGACHVVRPRLRPRHDAMSVPEPFSDDPPATGRVQGSGV